jgi:hypothetical protein
VTWRLRRLSINVCPSGDGPVVRLGDLFTRMSFKVAGRSEFSQFMPYHELRHIHGDELVAVVHRQRMTHKIRRDRRATAPGFDHPFLGCPFIDSQHFFL